MKLLRSVKLEIAVKDIRGELALLAKLNVEFTMEKERHSVFTIPWKAGDEKELKTRRALGKANLHWSDVVTGPVELTWIGLEPEYDTHREPL
jgi:hypothetical protein